MYIPPLSLFILPILLPLASARPDPIRAIRNRVARFAANNPHANNPVVEVVRSDEPPSSGSYVEDRHIVPVGSYMTHEEAALGRKRQADGGKKLDVPVGTWQKPSVVQCCSYKGKYGTGIEVSDGLR